LFFTEDESSVENATITLDSTSLPYTSDNKTAFNSVEYGVHTIRIEASNLTISSQIEIYSDSTYVIYMDKPEFSIVFHCLEMYSNRNLSAMRIAISGNSKTTDFDGLASIVLKQDSYDYTITRDGYETITESIDLKKDTILTLYIRPVTADAKFKLSREGTPINNAEVSIGTKTGITNNIGIYTFSELETEQVYEYQIVKENYKNISDEIYIRVDTSIYIEMEMSETGIANIIEEEAISIYPNPTRKQITVESGSGINSIRIISMLGEEIFSEELIDKKLKTIDLQSISAGIYFVEIEDNTGNSVIRKLIKQ
jgi:hypothetical protein